ncbi:chemokine XC receptor 1 [Rhinophrynus dorsalis]
MQETTDYIDFNTSYLYDDFSQPCNKDDIYIFATHLTTIFNSLLFFLSIIGNCLVLWILVKYEHFVSLTNVFIFNLSIADLILSSWLPFFIVYHRLGWVFGWEACKAINAFFSIGFYSGIIFLALMTFHRYLAVVDPLSALKVRKPVIGIMTSVVSWLISILASVPVMIFKVQTKIHDFTKCEYTQVLPELASNYQQNISFLLAFSVIIICYLRIIRALRRSRSQRNHKPVKLILIIVVVYFLCWAPYNIVMFLQSLHKQHIFMDCQFIKHLDYAKSVTEKLAISHCCLNPILYAFVGIKFRRHLKHLLNCYDSCKQEEQNSTIRINFQDHYHNNDASLY